MEELDKNEWESFVLAHPKGNIFQTPYFYSVYSNTKNMEPILVYTKHDNEITAVLLAYIQKDFSGIIGKLTERSIIIGGPIVKEDNTLYLEEILSKYIQIIKGKVIYSQFRNFWDWDNNRSVFEKFGFNYSPHLNIIINVSDLNLLEQGISKNKKRNITKSNNKGVSFIEITTAQEYYNSLKLIKLTYKKIGLPYPDDDFFLAAFQSLYKENKLKIFGALWDGKIIGVRYQLIYKDIIYDWYAGSNEVEANKYPNDFLIYNVLLWGNKNNFKEFDFGGAGKPGIPYGVRDHKLKFSSNIVEFGRFEKTHKKILYLIALLGLKLYKITNDLFKK